MKNSQILVERANFGRMVNIHWCHVIGDGQVEVALPVTMQVFPDEAALADPCLRLRPHEAQLLADGLWQAGFRPTQGQQSEGQMGATSKHLNDMRAIVEKLVKVELPK